MLVDAGPAIWRRLELQRRALRDVHRAAIRCRAGVPQPAYWEGLRSAIRALEAKTGANVKLLISRGRPLQSLILIHARRADLARSQILTGMLAAQSRMGI